MSSYKSLTGSKLLPPGMIESHAICANTTTTFGDIGTSTWRQTSITGATHQGALKFSPSSVNASPGSSHDKSGPNGPLYYLYQHEPLQVTQEALALVYATPVL